MKSIRLPFKYSAAGFTLLELLIAVALSGFIFMGVSALIFTLFTSNTRSKQLELLEQAKHDIVSDISTTLKWANTVTFDATTQTLEIDGGAVRYLIDNDQLTKNGEPLTPSEISVSDFSVSDRSVVTPDIPFDEAVSAYVTMNLVHRHFVAAQSTLSFVVSQRVAITQ